ncbi:MAG: DnaJ domain-containing protein [Fimbriimonas sp.]|nr:DnaJ domain-containing protein [Fimbriimonas sp.]
MKTLTSFYEVLGVGPTAEPDTLRKAYRRLARKHHPDVSSDPRAHENMARINEAFETLIDRSKRNEYDAMLAGGGFEDDMAQPATAPQRPVIVRLIQRLNAHKTPVYAITFAPDTGQLVSSAFDNEILWWDESSASPKRRTKVETGVISTLRAFSLDRLVAAGSAETQVSFCRLEGERVESFKTNNEEWVGAIAISADGSSVAAGSLHHTVAVTRTTDGGIQFRKHEHAGAVTAVAWSQDGRYLATGSADATVKLWHAQTGALLHTFRQVRSTVTSIAFSNDNRFVIAAGVDLSIRVFSLNEGELVKMMFGHTKPIESLSFHPNNWLFASGSRDGTVGLWNAAKGIGNVRIDCSPRPVSCVAFSPDGTRLAAGGQDKVVRLWEVAAKEAA